MNLTSEHIKRAHSDDGVVIDGAALLRSLGAHVSKEDAKALETIANRLSIALAIPDDLLHQEPEAIHP